MTDNEIVQVAKCCIQSQSKADCFRLGCPAATAGGDNCRIWELTNDDSDNAVLNQIIKELVTVINRKNADIEELKSTFDKERADRLYLSHQNKAIIAGQETLQKALAEKNTEIKRLKAENELLQRNADEAFQEGLNENRSLFVKEVIQDIQQVICDNTYPDADSSGNAVMIWKARTGYDAVKDAVLKMVGEG